MNENQIKKIRTFPRVTYRFLLIYDDTNYKIKQTKKTHDEKSVLGNNNDDNNNNNNNNFK